jgi:signal transduction histidine kinase
VLVASGAAILVALGVVGLALRLATPWDGTEWLYDQNRSAAVAAQGAAARPVLSGSALRPGERVLAINGVSLADLRRPPFDPPWSAPTTPLEYEIVHAATGERRTASQALIGFPAILLLAEDWPIIVTTLAWLSVAGFVFARRPREPAAQLMLLLGAAFIPQMFWRWLGISDVYAGPMFSFSALMQPVYLSGLVSMFFLAVVFPRPAPWATRHRRSLLAVAAMPAAAAIAVLVAAQMTRDPTLLTIDRLSAIEATTYLVVGAALAVVVPLRYRALTDPADRRRFVTVIGTLAVVGALILAVWMLPSFAWGSPLLPWAAAGLVALPIPIAIGVAILRYGAFDLQRAVNRSLVYGGATTAIALIYIFLVGTAVLSIQQQFGFAVALLATGLVIVIAQPVRDGVQRAVNRLMYGDRDDPYQGIARLGERLESSLPPNQLLPVVVDTVAATLRLPYVAIEHHREGRPIISASHGEAVADPFVVPLIHHAETVGRLLLAPRAGEVDFSDTDRRLLAALARQISAAVKTVELDDELRRSRERLVAAREEERRQLRRELHDGLGPTLAGSLLQLQAARAALAKDPERAAELIGRLEAETRQAITEVRRLARDLRPPALDDLGLLGALREQTGHFSANPALKIDLQTTDELPPLPAAVEVAVYRIVLEALANCARHAQAKRCWVRLEVGDEFVASVSDNGVGIAEGTPQGVGMRSMNERAAELGGRLAVKARPGGGTIVEARLPLQPLTQ